MGKSVNDFMNEKAKTGRRFVKLPNEGDSMILVVGPSKAHQVVESEFEGKTQYDADGDPVMELQLAATLESHDAEGSRGYDGPGAGDEVIWTVKTGAKTALQESLGEAGRKLEEGLRLKVTRGKNRKTSKGKAFTYEVEVLKDAETSADDAAAAKKLIDDLD